MKSVFWRTITPAGLRVCVAALAVYLVGQSVNAQITTNGDFNIDNINNDDPWFVGGDGNSDGFGDSSLRLIGTDPTTSMTIAGGSLVSNQFGEIASAVDGEATVTVTGTGSQWNHLFDLSVGTAGDSVGTLVIENGGSVTNVNSVLGGTFSQNSTGLVTVDGTGSSWTNTGTISIGNRGSGTLTITNGGVVESTGASVTSLTDPQASSSTSIASVIIDGAGSRWTNSGDLIVGNNGSTPATPSRINFDISNGGEMTVGGMLTIREFGNFDLDGGTLNAETIDVSAGSATGFEVTFNNSELNVDNVIGDLAQSGGTLTSDGTELTEFDSDYGLSNGVIEIELGGLLRGVDYDAIDVAGIATFDNVTIEVSFVNGFTIGEETDFDIFDGAFGAGTNVTFDFTNAPLSGDGFWITDSFLTNGIITAAVPEPSALMALILASSLIATQRRKNVA